MVFLSSWFMSRFVRIRSFSHRLCVYARIAPSHTMVELAGFDRHPSLRFHSRRRAPQHSLSPRAAHQQRSENLSVDQSADEVVSFAICSPNGGQWCRLLQRPRHERLDLRKLRIGSFWCRYRAPCQRGPAESPSDLLWR